MARAATYLDNAATRPLSQEAFAAWVEAVRLLQATPGNPAALHSGGRSARRLLEDARERVASSLGAEKNEVIFTSGATESNALAVLGAARESRENDPARTRIAVSGVEHDAVGKQAAIAEREGFTWEVIPVGPDGVTQLAELSGDGLAVASMSLVCAETGVLQPVRELVEVAAGAPVHTDAAQALGYVPVNFAELGTDLLTLSGHKVGAPVGTGALLARRDVSIRTDRLGGGQERQLRSGTVDVAGAVALAAAIEAAVRAMESRAAAARKLGEYLVENLPPGVQPTTSADASPAIVHLSLDTAHPEALLLVMDQRGVSVSAGSACHAGVTRPSEVLLRMGRTEKESLGVLRVSFGPENDAADVDRFLTALPAALEAAQKLDEKLERR